MRGNILFFVLGSWIHKKYIGIPGPLNPNASFRCKRRTGQAWPIDGSLMTEVTVGRGKFRVVPSFCYLGDYLSSDGGCELATITRCRVAWGKFNLLLPVLTFRSFPITSRGRVHNSCVRGAMLRASLTWAPTLSDLHRMQGNDRAMIHWVCSVPTKDQVSSQDLLRRSCELTWSLVEWSSGEEAAWRSGKVLRTRQLRWWHGHVERCDGWFKKVQKLNPTGGRGHGRPKKT